MYFQMSQSDNKSVTIRSVQRDQTGYYKCEVSADAPLFHTDIKKILIVVTGKGISLFTSFVYSIRFTYA